MKKGDKEWLIFAETGKWISSLFASHCCPWFLPSRSSATATATAPAAIPSSSLDGILKNQPNPNCDHKMKGTAARADSTLNWIHHDSDLPDFYFRTIQKENVEQVAEFLLKYFFAEEPLGQSLQLDPNKEVRPWLSKMLEHEIREGLSIVVRLRSLDSEDSTVDNQGEIVAVCLNDVERKVNDPEDVNIFTFVERDSQPNMWMITRVLDELVSGEDVFNGYQVESLVSCQMLCVNPRFGGRGLAQKLIQLTEELTKTLGYSLIISEATSEFSARAFLKAGFLCLKTIQYDAFTIDGDQQPFQQLSLDGVHTAARLMIKHLK